VGKTALFPGVFSSAPQYKVRSGLDVEKRIAVPVTGCH
jgi:hypothetical protein